MRVGTPRLENINQKEYPTTRNRFFFFLMILLDDPFFLKNYLFGLLDVTLRIQLWARETHVNERVLC